MIIKKFKNYWIGNLGLQDLFIQALFVFFASNMTTQKLRILFLTYQGDMAGSTNSIAYLAKGLARRGHHVSIGIRKESLLWQLLEGSAVNRIPMTFSGKFDLGNWKNIRDAVKENDIQLINAQSSHDRYTSIFANWWYKLGVKIIHTRRQMPMSMGGPIQLYLYNKKTDGVVAVGGQVKEGLVQLGVKADHIEVIHNGTPREKYKNLDQPYIDSLRVRFNITEGDFVMGCVSRPKNQEQIFKALKLIEHPIKVIFCGLKKEEPYLSHMAEFKADHQIYFEGDVPGDKVLNYFKVFDIKILASTMEGLSQSLLESMALGVPVTATAFAGNLDLIVDEENGLLFKDGDIRKIADNIERLRTDEVLRNSLREQGLVTAYETYSIENTINNYEAYFADLID